MSDPRDIEIWKEDNKNYFREIRIYLLNAQNVTHLNVKKTYNLYIFLGIDVVEPCC